MGCHCHQSVTNTPPGGGLLFCDSCGTRPHMQRGLKIKKEGLQPRSYSETSVRHPSRQTAQHNIANKSVGNVGICFA